MPHLACAPLERCHHDARREIFRGRHCRRLGLAWMLVAPACTDDTVLGAGLLGEPIALMSGDASPLPRLAYVDEGCPGASARGGCDPDGGRPCKPLLVDTLAPLTVLADDADPGPRFSRECLEVRTAAGLAAESPTGAELNAAVARFRFRNTPLVRVASAGTDAWTWFAGTPDASFRAGGVLGGNVLRRFAVALRTPKDDVATLALYAEFPGSDEDLADQGRAFIAVQFPGRLLGRDVADRCQIGDDGCRTTGYDIVRGQPNIALEASRMVVDACVAAPPCAVRYDVTDVFDVGTCRATKGPELDAACEPAATGGGRTASLVIATSVPGLVLFSDSAQRMFGPLASLPPCNMVTADAAACRVPQGGALAVPGWPVAGADTPLSRLRVRSVALLAGLAQTRGPTACTRLEQRRTALFQQCDNFVDAFANVLDIGSTSPPYAPDAPASSMVLVGESMLLGQAPDIETWIDTLVLPADHPLPVALRLDLSPEAIQPDGLLGSALFADTQVVLDYTDPNPGVRVSCLDPRAGRCMAAPDCAREGHAACCHGLPLNLLVDFIIQAQDDTCCAALSAAELAEIQAQGHCLATPPP